MALFKQMGMICEDSIVHPDMNDVLNRKLGTSQIDYPSNKWADKVAVLGEPLPSKTASGTIAHFTDGADNVPLDEGVFYFTPQQATGTPSPSDPISVYGHTGLNVFNSGFNFFNEEWEAGTINDTTGQPTSSTTQIRSKSFSDCKGGVTYYVKVGSNNSIRVFWYDKNQNFISQTSNIANATATAPENARYLKIRGTNAYGTSYLDDVSVTYPSTDTDYHAYVTPATYPVSWSEHGTVYGGYYNSVTGELWKTYEIVVFNGAESETWAVYGSQNGFAKTISDMKSGSAMLNGYSNFLTTINTYTGFGIRFGGNNNNTIYLCHITDNITGVSDVASWKTYLQTHNLQVVYPLATPVLVAVIGSTKIKTFEGENNIWNDGGGISEVGYRSKASGGEIPTFTETLICDNTELSTGTLTFTDDIEDYDILDFECYNADSQKITHYLTVPEVIMAIKNASSDYVNFNEIGTNQYACYGVSSDNLTWTVRGRRNMLIKSVTGYVCSNMTVTKTEFYKRNSLSPVIATVEPVEDVMTYHYIFTASGDGANDQTQPCGMAMQIDSLFNDNSIGFFNRYNSLTAPIIAKSHSISCADAYGDNYWILCYYGLKFT